ncbi:MAG TPA: hypothetical protein VFV53_03395 [Candidatus Limnocylindrales bacterium]|nr:hypothetical protein [Candidatus Limnocylindrales bacterium]
MQPRIATRPRPTRLVAALLVAAVVAACGGAASPTPRPGATTFEEFRTANCAAWEAMFRGVGNPDTAAGSDLSHALEAAIEAGDEATVEAKAAAIRTELEAGREHAAFAGAWEPGAAPMAAMDAVLVAFEAYIEAERGAAMNGLSAAKGAGQAAFEAAGAMKAWETLLTRATWAEVDAARPAGDTPQPCGDLPISF